MKIVSFDELTKADINNSYDFSCIDMQDRNIFELLSEIKEPDCCHIVNILNTIGNQGILEINKDLLYYSIQDKREIKKLPISSLSTSESIFFIAALADILKKQVILSNDIYQLTKTTAKLFYHTFKDSDYIILAFESEFDADYYKDALYGGE